MHVGRTARVAQAVGPGPTVSLGRGSILVELDGWRRTPFPDGPARLIDICAADQPDAVRLWPKASGDAFVVRRSLILSCCCVHMYSFLRVCKQVPKRSAPRRDSTRDRRVNG